MPPVNVMVILALLQSVNRYLKKRKKVDGSKVGRHKVHTESVTQECNIIF